jgi:hypothetical protein
VEPRRGQRSWDTALPTLVVSALAAWRVPPSGPAAGISDLESRLLAGVGPCLWAALALGLITAAVSLLGKHRSSGLYGVLCLVLVNVAGLLSAQFGAGGTGVVTTLLVTSPLAIVMALRESRWRRQGVET